MLCLELQPHDFGVNTSRQVSKNVVKKFVGHVLLCNVLFRNCSFREMQITCLMNGVFYKRYKNDV